ncbi:MAG: sugar ABC transporter permease [Solobacterium sp.]|nr:sugar ABC transporter permease [Solobacterium sp.]
MQKGTAGTVISVRKLWPAVNNKPVRLGPFTGAYLPYIVKVRYTAEGQEYTVTKWIGTDYPVPAEGDEVEIVYDTDRPKRIKIVY